MKSGQGPLIDPVPQAATTRPALATDAQRPARHGVAEQTAEHHHEEGTSRTSGQCL